MRFTIFTHVHHKKHNNSVYGYGPYVREMDLWLKFVQITEIVAPIESALPEAAEVPYQASNLIVSEIPSLSFVSVKERFKSALILPIVCFRVLKAMRRADHLHLRCPGNIGLIASVLQILYPEKPKTAKYAGNWDPMAEQPWTYRLQKWILSNTFLTRNMQVLVYGEWPVQTTNLVPSFTASFSEKEIESVREKCFFESITFLFVGNLVKGKRPLEAIKLVKELNVRRREGAYQMIPAKLKIYGKGPERRTIEIYIKQNNLEGMVTLEGELPLEELKAAYQQANFVILPSRSEGWPKAIAEGMFFGCIPIATSVSCVPWMLGYGSRGLLLEEGTIGKRRLNDKASGKGLVNAGEFPEDIRKLEDLLDCPQLMTNMSEAAKAWSQKYTLERFEAAIKHILHKADKKRFSPFQGESGLG